MHKIGINARKIIKKKKIKHSEDVNNVNSHYVTEVVMPYLRVHVLHHLVAY